LKEQYADLESRYRALMNVHHNEDKKRVEKKGSIKFDDEYGSESQDKSLHEIRPKKAKRVVFDDIKGYGYELSLNLRLKRISLDTVIKYFESLNTKSISTYDMKTLLLNEPFAMKDENSA